MSEHYLVEAITKHESTGHSVFGPSSSAMWLFCAGSLRANLGVRDDAGYDAAEGTVAHALGEKWLKTGRRPDHMVGKTKVVREGAAVHRVLITEEMLDYLQEYVDWCMYLPGDTFVEKRVYFSQLMPIPNQGGTADHFACEPGVLTITDLKFGQGEIVYAKNNTQGMLYALGVFYEWDWMYNFQRIIIRIAQPRRDHMDVWECTRDELMEFAGFVRARAADAWKKNASRMASEKTCRWCKVTATCPAYIKMMYDIIDGYFDEMETEVTSAVQNEAVARLDVEPLGAPELPLEVETRHLVELERLEPAFTTYFKKVYSELLRRAQNEGVPGKKIVESSKYRAFRDQSKVIRIAKSVGIDEFELFKSDFISPAQLEALMKKAGVKKAAADKLLEDVVFKPPGGPTLVSESDKRPALVQNYDDAFDDEEL